MRGKTIYIITLTLLLLTGCANQKPTETQIISNKIDTPQGMTSYLTSQNIPALQSVQPWQNHYAPGVTINTEHYQINTTLLEPLMLARLPGFVEAAYRQYQQQIALKKNTNSKFIIYLFENRDQWEKMTTEFVGRNAPLYLKIKAGAYYLNGATVAYHIGTERTFSVIGHEGWHQFNCRHFKLRLPSWLDEGVAMLFEANEYNKSNFQFDPAKNLSRLASLRKTIVEKKMIPLTQLLAMNPGQAIVASEDAVEAFYAQSYALARFLREENYCQYLPRFQKLMRGAVTGDWPITQSQRIIAQNRNIPLTIRWNQAVGPALFKYYIEPDIQQIEKQYYNFCRKIVYRVRYKKIEPKTNGQ